jgi:hypothetical protein
VLGFSFQTKNCPFFSKCTDKRYIIGEKSFYSVNVSLQTLLLNLYVVFFKTVRTLRRHLWCEFFFSCYNQERSGESVISFAKRTSQRTTITYVYV